MIKKRGEYTPKIEINLKDHYGLVHQIARQYQHKCIGALGYDDLVQVGLLGVMHAAELFDKKKGYKFSTYAVWWIRAFIQRETAFQYQVKLPAHAIEKNDKLWKKTEEFLTENGRYPTDKELARLADMQVATVRVMRCLPCAYLPFDGSVRSDDDDDDARTYGGFLRDENPFPEDEVLRADLIGHLIDVIDRLRPKLNSLERSILDRRLLAENPLRLQVLGDEFDLTRERVRQVQVKLLRKIKLYLRIRKPWLQEAC
jgi:RNA polymerase primary sigma factor